MKLRKNLIYDIENGTEKFRDFVTGEHFSIEDLREYKEITSDERIREVLQYEEEEAIRKYYKTFLGLNYYGDSNLSLLEVVKNSNKNFVNHGNETAEKWLNASTTIEKYCESFYKLEKKFVFFRISNLFGYFYDDEFEVFKEKLKFESLISVNGGWGSGKSTFIQLLQRDSTYKVEYINVSSNIAMYDNAYTMVYDFFINFFDESKIKNIFKNCKKSAANILNKIVKSQLGIDVDEIKKLSVDEERYVINQYYNELSSKSQVDFLISILNENLGENSVLILDELDRLLPEEMLRILNMVNYLNKEVSNNLKIVIVYNREIIESSLKHMYGLNDSKNFLEKYIDSEILLETLNNEQLLSNYMEFDDNIFKEYQFAANPYSAEDFYENYDFKSCVYNSDKIGPGQVSRKFLSHFGLKDLKSSWLYSMEEFHLVFKQMNKRDILKYSTDISNSLYIARFNIYNLDTNIIYLALLIKYVNINFYNEIVRRVQEYDYLKYEIDKFNSTINIETIVSKDTNFNEYLNCNMKLLNNQPIKTMINEMGFYFTSGGYTTDINININGQARKLKYFFVRLSDYLKYIK